MAASYMDLLKQARVLAEKDISRVVEKLQQFKQHFPDLVDKAVGAISQTSGRITAAARTKMAPVTAPPVAAVTVTKTRRKSRLNKAQSQKLRDQIKASLRGKVKQVDFIEKFVADHPGYKPATVHAIITALRSSWAIKSEPVVKGNSKAGLYLMPRK